MLFYELRDNLWYPLGDWEEWARCSVSCGVGVETRHRVCIGKSDEDRFGCNSDIENRQCGEKCGEIFIY